MTSVSTDDLQISVRKATEESRFEAVLDGAVVGIADYTEDEGRVVFTHVEVTPAWQGQGIASRLVRAAFDEVIAQGKGIRPLCPFAVGYVHRNPEYAEHTGS
jgi:predicted GNAT family acetyltransferase